MKCGDRYRHLIRTRSGYTYANRCGSFCHWEDEGDWADAARDLGARVHRAAARLETLPPDLEQQLQEMDARLQNELPSWWEIYLKGPVSTPSQVRSRVDGIVELMDFQVCIFEQLQSAIESSGGTPELVPDLPTSWGPLLFAGGAVVAGVGGILLYRWLRRTE